MLFKLFLSQCHQKLAKKFWYKFELAPIWYLGAGGNWFEKKTRSWKSRVRLPLKEELPRGIETPNGQNKTRPHSRAKITGLHKSRNAPHVPVCRGVYLFNQQRLRVRPHGQIFQLVPETDFLNLNMKFWQGKVKNVNILLAVGGCHSSEFFMIHTYPESSCYERIRAPDPRHFEADPDPGPWIRTLDYGSGSGFCSFRQWLSRFKQKKKFFPPRFYAYYTFCRYQSSKITSHKEVTNELTWRLFLTFLLVDGSIHPDPNK